MVTEMVTEILAEIALRERVVVLGSENRRRNCAKEKQK